MLATELSDQPGTPRASMSASMSSSTRAATAATTVSPPESKKQRTARDVASVAKQSTASPAPTAAPSTPTTSSSGAKAVAKAKFCINCQKELTRNIRITCVECVSPTTQRPLIELCIECFAVGTELGDHKKTHKYTVSDCLAYPIVRESREYAQSMREASVATSTTTTPQKDASSSSNGSSGAAPSPAPPSTSSSAVVASDWTADEELLLLEGIEMVGMGNWKDIAEHVGTKSEKKCEAHYMGAYLRTPDRMPRFLDDPQDDSILTTPSDASNATSATSAALPSAQASAPLLKPSTVSELAGYMPLRGDFDVEYENEAELIVADMEFSEDDHPTERALKLEVLSIYNAKLDERARRKAFVVAHGLLDYKRHQSSERRRPKDERELVAQLRPFARYQTPEEHEAFVQGLVTAMRLRKQIVILQEYRKNGVRTLAEAELYDVEKKKRETEQALQKQRDSAAYLYESGRPASTSRDRANRMLQRDQAAGDAPASAGHDKPGRESESTRTRSSGASGASSGSGDSGASSASSFLIDGAPGCHLLTPPEKELCSKLKLLPKVRLSVCGERLSEAWTHVCVWFCSTTLWSKTRSFASAFAWATCPRSTRRRS